MSDVSLIDTQVRSDLLEADEFRVTFTDVNGELSLVEEGLRLDNPYEFDPERFLPNTVAMTLPRFFSVAAEVINDAQAREGKISSKRVPLVEEYAAEYMSEMGDEGDEVIAFRVLRRRPSPMNPSATDRQQRKAMFSYSLQSKNHPNKVIEVESRPVDTLIEFSCWAKSNRLANLRALWLEKLFISYSWAFAVKGAERFYWEDRGADTYMTHGQQRLFYRPLNFTLRTREFEVKTRPALRSIDVEFSLRRS